MFGRQVTMQLKADSSGELTHLNDSVIIPLMRKQKGFVDQTTLIAPERLEAVTSSFWATKEDAEAYSLTTYSDVLQKLATVLDGTPIVKFFEIANLTIHQQRAVSRIA